MRTDHGTRKKRPDEDSRTGMSDPGSRVDEGVNIGYSECDDETSSRDMDSRTTYGSAGSKQYIKTNRRINLQRFTVYKSLTTMYIVGSNAKESLFRIIEITSDAQTGSLSIIEDKNYFYTRTDVIELIRGLNESIDGGIHKIAHAFGLLGFIRFTDDYYLCVATKCSQVAIIGGHFIYHIDETKLIPLALRYRRPYKYSDEDRLLSIFKYLDLGKTFYFSYSYDITNTLQTNLTQLRPHNKIWKEDENNAYHPKSNLNERFVWNKLLLEPVLMTDIATYEWFQPIVHGFIDQASISIYGRKLFITIIARRSHHFAGARFLKRGVNHAGDVANEVETEQIVSDMLTSSFHDPQNGLFANSRLTSFVQHRGSIPLYWTQDLNRLPKPPIEISLSDPYYQSSALHFNDLIKRYGSPILIVNLIKTKEKHPRELKLSKQFVNCVKYLNQFMPSEGKLQYFSFDMSKHSKKNADVIGPIESLAASGISKTGFFHNGKTLEETKLQRGIMRTNCIDCLDRTNAAQFIVCKEALSEQLKSLGFLEPSANLDYDSDLLNILTEMFHDHGDTIAVQYGGSNLVNTMDSYRRINQWSSHTRDILNSIKRIYSNSFIDVIRQEAINLFLGNYIYKADKPKLWELQNDYYLHNQGYNVNFAEKVSYRFWYNKNTLDDCRKLERAQHHSSYSHHREQNELSDSWFNECYIPGRFQSLSEIFQFNMNSNARYFPSSTNEAKAFNYSPFGVRKEKIIRRSHNSNSSSRVGTRSPDDLDQDLPDTSSDFSQSSSEAITMKSSLSHLSCSDFDKEVFTNSLAYAQNLVPKLRIEVLCKNTSDHDADLYRGCSRAPAFNTTNESAYRDIDNHDIQQYWQYLEQSSHQKVLMTDEQYFW